MAITDEEKAQQEKDAVVSMKAAQANMTKALDRIKRLEWALGEAATALSEASKSSSGYPWRSEESFADKYRKAAEKARAEL